MTDSTLSHYRITAELGRGGMGIVYRAQDTRLDRAVALKVLPPHALPGDDDRARFYREARAAARLSHAHIATVYEIGEAVPEDAPHGSEPRPFIAMEFVDGESLAARIARGPLKLEEAVRVAREVAEALGAAHEAGVVHRDVKSGNVMLTAKGGVKVLDFGLAKTGASTRLTQAGTTLGTVGYMSPEQARGEDVDGRTDLWALGVVLYEMVSGRLPFAGDYEQAIIYGILNEEPEPLTALRTGVPLALEGIVEKLLRKEARLRYQTAADVIADLEAIAVDASSSVRRTASRSTLSARSTRSVFFDDRAEVSKRRWPLALGMGLVGLLAGILGAAALLRSDGTGSQAPVSAEVVRSSLLLPNEYPVVVGGGDMLGMEINALDLARDGSRLVYVTERAGKTLLAVRHMDDGTLRLLDGTEGAFHPVFSPDGRFILYVAGTAVYRISVEGGRPEFVTNVADPTGLVWLPDGTIYVTDQQGRTLNRIRPGGERETVPLAERCNCGLPTEGPGGVGVVVSGRDAEAVLWYRGGTTLDTLRLRGNHVTFLPSGHVLYTRTGVLLASRYDPATGAIQDGEHTVLDDIRTGSVLRSGHYAVSDGGTLVYAAGAPSGLVRLVIRRADGTEEELALPAGVYGPVDVTPDGRRVLVTSYDRGGQVLVYDGEAAGTRTLPPGAGSGAIWGPDGKTVTYVIQKGESARVFSLDLDQSGQGTLLFETRPDIFLSAWSPDGRWLAYRQRFVDLVFRNVADGTEQVIASEANENRWAADFSPDGRYVSYTLVDEAGSRIFVEPFPPTGETLFVSPGSGEEAEWLPDRNALVYRDGFDWYLVDYVPGPPITFSTPRLLFSGSYINVAGMEYRMLAGGRALLQRPVNTARTVGRIEVVTNEFTVLEAAFE